MALADTPPDSFVAVRQAGHGMRCANCLTESVSGAMFCSNCGLALAAARPDASGRSEKSARRPSRQRHAARGRASVRERKVGVGLFLGIAFFPYLFAWVTLRKGHSGLARAGSFGWMAALFLVIIIDEAASWRQASVASVASEPPADLTESSGVADVTSIYRKGRRVDGGCPWVYTGTAANGAHGIIEQEATAFYVRDGERRQGLGYFGLVCGQAESEPQIFTILVLTESPGVLEPEVTLMLDYGRAASQYEKAVGDPMGKHDETAMMFFIEGLGANVFRAFHMTILATVDESWGVSVAVDLTHSARHFEEFITECVGR